jgi:hypothetical protein
MSDNSGRENIVMYVRVRGDMPISEHKNDYVWKLDFNANGGTVSEWV